MEAREVYTRLIFLLLAAIFAYGKPVSKEDDCAESSDKIMVDCMRPLSNLVMEDAAEISQEDSSTTDTPTVSKQLCETMATMFNCYQDYARRCSTARREADDITHSIVEEFKKSFNSVCPEMPLVQLTGVNSVTV